MASNVYGNRPSTHTVHHMSGVQLIVYCLITDVSCSELHIVYCLITDVSCSELSIRRVRAIRLRLISALGAYILLPTEMDRFGKLERLGTFLRPF